MSRTRFRRGPLALLLALATVLFASPASAFGPSVMFTPSGACTRPYCVTYAKTAQLPSGRLVATFEDNNQPAQGQTFPIFTSTDDGRTWAKTSTVADTSPRRWGNWTNPYLYVLPQRFGSMPAGTLLLAGISSPPDRSATAIQLYRSNDEGRSWTWVSEVALGGGQWGSANPTPIWEPYVFLDGGTLAVYYSDERHPAQHSQKIVHQASTDGRTWGPVVDDVALSDPALRPGMPNVVRMADGRYLMTYEVMGLSGGPNNFKTSASAGSWNAADAGTTIDYGGSPVVIALPDGRLAYNSYGSSDIRINTGNGTGAWTPVLSNLPGGYSRALQYVQGTGRVLVVSIDGFWINTPHSVYYGDVDLGNSAGPYYKIVNRKSGKVLDVSAQSLTDGADVLQWADNGGANQLWHLSEVTPGYRTLLNKNSGRALSIWATGTADGDRAVQWVENDKNDQDWQLVPAGAYYKIISRNSGKLLCILGGSTADGGSVVQWADTGSLDQQWQVVPAGTAGRISATLASTTFGYGSRPRVQLRVAGAQGSPDPTGTVTVLDGERVVGSAALSAHGQGTAALSADLAPGSRTLKVAYSGDSRYAPVSADVAVTVTPVATRTALTLNRTTIRAGSGAQASVEVDAPDCALLGSSITVEVTGSVTATYPAALDARHRAKVTIGPFSAPGRVVVIARYAATAGTSPSASPPRTLTIQP